jgi:hypothetical protein
MARPESNKCIGGLHVARIPGREIPTSVRGRSYTGGWNGDPDRPNWYTRLHYDQMYVPKILERMQKSAPPGADLTGWRY